MPRGRGVAAVTAVLVVCLFLNACVPGAADPTPEFNYEEREGGLAKPTDEEIHAKVRPDSMKCDVCAAASFWIHRALKLAHKERFHKKLKEIDIIEAIDDICLPKTFSRTYGIKSVNGVHHLSGGGTKWFYHQAPAAGIYGPGHWINAECRAIQGEFGEDELYDLFWKWHVVKSYEPSDVPFFKEVCIRRMRSCTEKTALESYDGYEAKHVKEQFK